VNIAPLKRAKRKAGKLPQWNPRSRAHEEEED